MRKIVITESERRSILEKYTTLGNPEVDPTTFVVGNYYCTLWYDEDKDTGTFEILKVLEIDEKNDKIKYLVLQFTPYNEKLIETYTEHSEKLSELKKYKYWQVDENEWNTILEYPLINNNKRVDGCTACIPNDQLKIGEYYKSADNGDKEIILITKIEGDKIYFNTLIFTERFRWDPFEWDTDADYSPIYEQSSKEEWDNAYKLPWISDLKNTKEEEKTKEEDQTKEDVDQDIVVVEKNDDKLMIGWSYEVTSSFTASTSDEAIKSSINESIRKLKVYYKKKLGQNTKINYNIGEKIIENVEEKTDAEGKPIFVATRTTKFTVTDVVDNDEVVCVGDCKNGEGTLTYPNGNQYSGTFTNGKLNGRGKFVDKTRSLKIVGNFVDGILNGNGAIKFDDGKTYKGTVKSDEKFEIISVVTPEGETINDVIQHHNNTLYNPNNNVSETPSFKFSGKIYFTDKLQTRNPISNGKITAVKIDKNKQGTETYTAYSNQEGNFTINLPRAFYNIVVSSNNQFFKPTELKNLKVYTDITQNFNLEESRAGRRQKKQKKIADDFVGIGVQTIFNNPVRLENRIHKKSDSKLEYCQRFTNYYYKVVLEKGGELSTLNKNNLINAKNFIIGCYKDFVSDYNEELVSKIKKLSNLGGNIEVFEL